ncbi:MAG: glycosyltransferase family A protein [Pacificimonas sp.]
MTASPLPAISVIIPLYNKAAHVRASIESALAQTYPAQEIIVVDDASSDESLDIVKRMSRSEIRILQRNQPGPGGYAARNYGIAQARGDWVAFLDADDLWQPAHLESIANAIAACGGQVGCAFTGVDIVQAGRRRPYKHNARLLTPNVPLSPETMLRAWLSEERCPIWTGASAFSISVLQRAGPFPAGRARRGGDKDMWLRAMLAAPTVFSSARTAEFHQDTQNRVTKATGHVDPPVLCTTIREILPTTSGQLRRLLKRTNNMELRLYARHAAGAGQTLRLTALNRFLLPSGLLELFGFLLFSVFGVWKRWSR